MIYVNVPPVDPTPEPRESHPLLAAIVWVLMIAVALLYALTDVTLTPTQGGF